MWTECVIQKQQGYSNVQRENRQNLKPLQCLHKEILVAGLEMLFTIHFFSFYYDLYCFSTSCPD